ncbi:MAG: thiamine phosphate synthase [Bacteroidales bacterium]|jgi:thiamine-phosphate pyrophosphorylase|nr:thiamine phosphate synthase [Bacteroidales bacterium]
MNGLLFITHNTERYCYLQSIEIALQGGCRRIQLRMKDAAPEEIERTGRQALTLCAQYGAELYIDDCVEVCKNLGATGVHLGKTDMSPVVARRMLGKNFIIGGTANTFDDIARLHAEGVDYIGLGPFRFTHTKKNLSPVLGLTGYRDILAQCRQTGIHLPIVAIGGITIADIPDLMRTGIAGIAMSSAILSADEPVAHAQRIIATIRSSEIGQALP